MPTKPLAIQLYGRLMGHKDTQSELEALIQAAQAQQGHLQLLHPTLSQAGGALIRAIPLISFGPALVLTEDGEYLVVADGDIVKVFQWRTGRLFTDFTQHTGTVNSVCVQGDLAFSASYDNTVKVWRWDTGELITDFTQHSAPVNGISVQSNLVFSVSDDHKLKIWHWHTGKVIAVFTADAMLTCIAFEPTRRILLAGDAGGHVHVLRVVGLDHLLFPDGTQKLL
jgi:WD40 repeat protein